MARAISGGAYVEIIGEEHVDDNALATSKENISTYYRMAAARRDIEANSTIYLIAHGDDVSHPNCRAPAFGDKSPNQVAVIIREILRDGGFGADNPFMGKIIIEGCHSAEPFPSRASKERMAQYAAEGFDINVALKKEAFEKNEVDGPSFLFLLKERLRGNFRRLFAPEVKIGGYLGAAYDGDYSQTGYGTSSTSNPATVRYQSLKNTPGRDTVVGQSYDESSSYLEVGIGRNMEFGRGGR